MLCIKHGCALLYLRLFPGNHTYALTSQAQACFCLSLVKLAAHQCYVPVSTPMLYMQHGRVATDSPDH